MTFDQTKFFEGLGASLQTAIAKAAPAAPAVAPSVDDRLKAIEDQLTPLAGQFAAIVQALDPGDTAANRDAGPIIKSLQTLRSDQEAIAEVLDKTLDRMNGISRQAAVTKSVAGTDGEQAQQAVAQREAASAAALTPQQSALYKAAGAKPGMFDDALRWARSHRGQQVRLT